MKSQERVILPSRNIFYIPPMDKPTNNNSQILEELRILAEERLTQQNLSSGVSALGTSSSPEEILRLVHELEVHRIELVMQQAELAQTRIELEHSLDLYTELYDFAPVGYLTLGRDSAILQSNLTATKMLGVDRSRLQAMWFTQLVMPEDHQALEALLENVFTKKVAGICEVTLA